ncbi:hypothetical protein MTO96_007063 [Rhipicephalus appendiculatus]
MVPSDIIEEEDMACDGGVNDQSGEGKEDLFIFGNASAVTHTKRDKEEQREVETIHKDCVVTNTHMKREEAEQVLHVKKPNTAGTEEKKNAIVPDDVMKVGVNSNKKRKSEKGHDEHAKNGEVGQVLQHEKAATSHGRQGTRSARKRAKRAKKKAQRQEIKPKEVVRTGIVGDEFDSLLRSGATDAFLKKVDRVRLSLRNNDSLLRLMPGGILQSGREKLKFDVAKCIPVADSSILCREFGEDKLPPPSARTVYALMALTLSTMESKSLFRDNKDNKQTALAYVLLKIKKLGLRSGNAIMNELSKYYALLFGKETLQSVSLGNRNYQQELQDEDQPPNTGWAI